MQVKIYDQTFILDNSQTSVNQIFEIVNNFIMNEGYILHSMIIDEMEIYENFEQYLYGKYETVQEIQINLITNSQFRNELISNGVGYLKRAIPAINELADELYLGSSENTGVQLTQLFEGIDWLIQMIQYICSTPDDNVYFVSNLDGILLEIFRKKSDLFEAINNKDWVLTGDYLQYEIVPIFENLYETLSQQMDLEV